jgi:hypothetical protein
MCPASHSDDDRFARSPLYVAEPEVSPPPTEGEMSHVGLTQFTCHVRKSYPPVAGGVATVPEPPSTFSNGVRFLSNGRMTVFAFDEVASWFNAWT